MTAITSAALRAKYAAWYLNSKTLASLKIDASRIQFIKSILDDELVLIKQLDSDISAANDFTEPRTTVTQDTRPFKVKAGTSLSYQIVADKTPLSYSASNLAPWMSLNTSSGIISGTAAAVGNTLEINSGVSSAIVAPQTFPIFVDAASAFGPSVNGPQKISILVTSTLAPTVTSAATDTVVHGTAYSYQIVAATATSFAAYSLPTGITLNPTTGVVSGTAPAAGTYTFKVAGINSHGEGVDLAVVLTVT